MAQKRAKEVVRFLSDCLKEKGLKVFDKPDSQDFYSGDYNELLEIDDKEGNIVDKNGNILGKHKGIWNYTIGQRKGIGIAAEKPLYVLELNKDKNEVVVGTEDKTFKKSLIAKNLNWVSIEKLDLQIEATAKIRSAQNPATVIVKPYDDGVLVDFVDLQKSITPGQSIVFYDNDIVLGGGIIEEIL